MLDLALDTRIFINNELDAALQELDMIFNTENTELIGYPQYGTNWYQFLWQLDYSPEDLQKLQLSTSGYETAGYPHMVPKQA